MVDEMPLEPTPCGGNLVCPNGTICKEYWEVSSFVYMKYISSSFPTFSTFRFADLWAQNFFLTHLVLCTAGTTVRYHQLRQHRPGHAHSLPGNQLVQHCTNRPRSLAPFCIDSNNMKLVKTSWTYSIHTYTRLD